MAYQTGTASSVYDLLDKLRLFCVAQSITVNEFKNDGTRDILSINYGGGYFHIGGTSTDIYCTQSTSFTTSTAWGSQPDQTSTTAAHTNELAAPFTAYHFFYFSNAGLYVTVEISAGLYRHFGVGIMNKWGSYTGGAFCFGTFINQSNTYIDNPAGNLHSYLGFSSATADAGVFRADNGSTPNYWYLYNNKPLTQRGIGNFELSTLDTASAFPNSTPSSSTQATALHAIELYILNQSNTNKGIPVGYLPDVRFINIQYFNGGDIFDTDWKVFPMAIKRDPSIRDNAENTGYYGLAFRFQ